MIVVTINVDRNCPKLALSQDKIISRRLDDDRQPIAQTNDDDEPLQRPQTGMWRRKQRHAVSTHRHDILQRLATDRHLAAADSARYVRIALPTNVAVRCYGMWTNLQPDDISTSNADGRRRQASRFQVTFLTFRWPSGPLDDRPIAFFAGWKPAPHHYTTADVSQIIRQSAARASLVCDRSHYFGCGVGNLQQTTGPERRLGYWQIVQGLIRHVSHNRPVIVCDKNNVYTKNDTLLQDLNKYVCDYKAHKITQLFHAKSATMKLGSETSKLSGYAGERINATMAKWLRACCK